MNTNMIGRLGLALVLLLHLGSCAYQFTGTRAQIQGVPASVEQPYRIFVPVADNLTNLVGLEAELPSAMARVIAGLSNMTLVNDQSKANLILAPRITNLERGRGLGTLQGSSETASAGGLAQGAVTAREFTVTAEVKLDLFVMSDGAQSQGQGEAWTKVWTRSFSSTGNYASSLRLIPSRGSSSSSIINQSRERLVLRTMSDDIARKVRDQVFQGF
jgi:hypothetical protein